MHVCYYNDLGLLVTHPQRTARRYLTRSFAIDFFSLLPMDVIVKLMTRETETNLSAVYVAQNLARYNRLLPLYRVFGVFRYFETDILKSRGVIM